MGHGTPPDPPPRSDVPAINTIYDARVLLCRYALRDTPGKQLAPVQRAHWAMEAISVLRQLQDELRKRDASMMQAALPDAIALMLPWGDALIHRYKSRRYPGVEFNAEQRRRWSADVTDLMRIEADELQRRVSYGRGRHAQQACVNAWRRQYENGQRLVQPVRHIQPFENVPPKQARVPPANNADDDVHRYALGE